MLSPNGIRQISGKRVMMSTRTSLRLGCVQKEKVWDELSPNSHPVQAGQKAPVRFEIRGDELCPQLARYIR